MNFADKLFHDIKRRYYADRNDIDLLTDISNQTRWKAAEVDDPSYLSSAFKRRTLKKVDRLLGDYSAGRRKASAVYFDLWKDFRIVSRAAITHVLDKYDADGNQH